MREYLSSHQIDETQFKDDEIETVLNLYLSLK